MGRLELDIAHRGGNNTDSRDQFNSVAQSCLTLGNPMDCSMPGFPVFPYLLEFAQIQVH